MRSCKRSLFGGFSTAFGTLLASSGAVLSPTVRDQLQTLLPETMVLNNFGSSESGHLGSAYPGLDTGQEGRPSFFMDETTPLGGGGGPPPPPRGGGGAFVRPPPWCTPS